MRTFFALLLIVNATAFANEPGQRVRAAQRGSPQTDLELRVMRLSTNIQTLVSNRLSQLHEVEQQAVLRNLQEARRTLLGLDDRPQRVVSVVCAQDNPTLYHQAFARIRDFADSSSGLAYYSDAARNFAVNWAQQYACSDVNAYISTLRQLKELADDSAYMGMYTDQAQSYALENINSTCPGMNYKAIYNEHLQFARSQQGLGMNTTSAHRYARERFEETALVCNNFTLD